MPWSHCVPLGASLLPRQAPCHKCHGTTHQHLKGKHLHRHSILLLLLLPRIREDRQAPLRPDKKNQNFSWSAECKQVGKALKIHLEVSPIGAFPDYGLKFLLNTDVSLTAISAVLTQVKGNKEHVIAYASCTLMVPETIQALHSWHPLHNHHGPAVTAKPGMHNSSLGGKF